jgi:putative transcriptional regulator
MPEQHLDEEILAEFSAGHLTESKAILVATHLTLCSTCRKINESYDAIGGSLLAISTGSQVGAKIRESVFEKLDEVEAEPLVEEKDAATMKLIPTALRNKLSGSITGLPWKKLGKSIKYVDILEQTENATARLMLLPSSSTLPTHTHQGTEMTVVLSGGFSECFGSYARGDVAVRDSNDTHQPKVDDGEDCLCFVVTDAPLRMKGLLGFFLNRLKIW